MSAVNITSPQSLNLYSYTRNNPIDFVDPTGLLCYIINLGEGRGYVEDCSPGDDRRPTRPPTGPEPKCPSGSCGGSGPDPVKLKIDNRRLISAMNYCINKLFSGGRREPGKITAFQATTSTNNGKTTFERGDVVENDGKSLNSATLTELFGDKNRPEAVIVGRSDGGFDEDGNFYARVVKTKDGNEYKIWAKLNYTATDASKFVKQRGVFSGTLLVQIHELGHSILQLKLVGDASHTEEELFDAGEEFEDCVVKRYTELGKKKKK